MKITAIILAGGLSRRMGRNKLNLFVEGEPMLQRVFDTALSAGFHEIILVRGEGTKSPSMPANAPDVPYEEILNLEQEKGIAFSIKLGLSVSDPLADGFVFLMADQPFLSKETLEILKERFQACPRHIIQPVYGTRPGGPVFFPASLKEDLSMLTGDTGGRQVMARHPELVLQEFLPESRESVDLDDRATYHKHVGRKRVLVKGAGDLATGVILALYQAGFEVIATEISHPSSIRTEVAFASALLEGEKTLEGVRAEKAASLAEVWKLLAEDAVPILIDSALLHLPELKPDVVVDAVIAKRNTGTDKTLAPLVIALGPGFTAGIDCHAVIETMRGNTLGDIITETGRSALPDTGTPGLIAGEDVRRVIHAPASGIIRRIRSIGDFVEEGDVIAKVGDTEVVSPLKGTLRGLIYDGFDVPEGLKIADVDPRLDRALAFSVSDKSHILGESVVCAISALTP